MNLNGYNFDSDNGHNHNTCVWWKAEKKGESFFLKRFKSPQIPRYGSPQSKKVLTDEFNSFRDERLDIKEALTEFAGPGGSIISPESIFMSDGILYQTTRWVNIKPWQSISNKTEDEKLLILRSAANCLRFVHSKGIIHCDLKPDNFPISKNETSGKETAKLMDFDSSHFEGHLPLPKKTVASDEYISPELYCYKTGRNNFNGEVTVKSDIFALGIIFHEYWTGKKIGVQTRKKANPDLPVDLYYEVGNNPSGITIDSSIPVHVANLIKRMISLDPKDRPSAEEVLFELKVPVKVPEKRPVKEEMTVTQEKRENSTFSSRFKTAKSNYVKGSNWPDTYTNFEVNENRNVVIFTLFSGNKTTKTLDFALKKEYIKKVTS